ncbi:FAS1-like dehydratase domain-containing protein [Novosphingobium panipatense]|uniref:3-methylfumaryl-CoA hydratase n=1 Tax=Novosphingobium panipatense TaxID=428991 RepID=A0ABY1QTL9_9SPHN|nr:MaoC family dehydratase N-terminal domain-containing protein [Novosphingobium panipatense]SMP80545.1 3-methylfumaryl-CoA hydratase [Novosphingobium panipatense]
MSGFEDWLGRSQSTSDVLDAGRSNALDLALGGDGILKAGDPLPALDHWLHFWDVRPPQGLGADGHPAKGGFLPPVKLPRRMWAGGRLTFHKPLFLGDEVRRTSTIVNVAEKSGRSGTLVFVTVRHELAGRDGLAVTEEQDLVYREPAPGVLPMPTAMPAPPAKWTRSVDPDTVLLFRYSALTMNGHRIHYDRPYAMAEEGYPALVVHGPLQAALLIRLAASSLDRPIASFEFRGQQPAFDGVSLHICGEPEEGGAQLWTQQGESRNMIATVRTA